MLVAMVVLMVVAVVVVVLDGIGKATSRSRPSHWVLSGLVELSAYPVDAVLHVWRLPRWPVVLFDRST